jgi:hypothetical protein
MSKNADTTGQEHPAELPPAFQPFAAAKAMKTTFDTLNNLTMASYRDAAKTLRTIRIPETSLKSMAATARIVQDQVSAQEHVLASFEALNRRKVQIEQATIDNAHATAILVDVAQKQEGAMESVVDLLEALVANQAASEATNRKRFIKMAVIAGISAAAGVTALVVNFIR